MMKNTRMKIFNFMIAVLLVFTAVPLTASATEDQVYISVSYDGKFIDDYKGNPIAYVPVSMAKLSAINLNEYGLSDFLYDENGDGVYEITALHLVIYAHEQLYGGSWNDVNFTGFPGGSYFEGGIFGFDENLNYYLNGEYPLASAGWGATSDQIVLNAGDYLDIGSFSDWNFYSDSNYGFHFFADEQDTFTHEYSIEDGNELSVKLVRSYSAMGSDAMIFDEPEYTIYYGKTLYAPNSSATVTNDEGVATITFPSAGTWYLWCDGAEGIDIAYGAIVSTPACAVVTVTEKESVTPLPVPETEVCKVFSDVGHNKWYETSVQYVYDNGIMSGNNGLFKPTDPITRAQVVMTLYNLEGKPEVTDFSAINDLVDVNANKWYTDAVCWAYSVGIANGNNVTKMFNMDTPVTRQQLATFFYNYAEYKHLDITTRSDISEMKGGDQVASYAIDKMQWAVGTGLITGSETTVNGATVYDLKPTGNASRAQMASILQRFIDNNNL